MARLLREQDVRSLLGANDAFISVEGVFKALAEGGAVNFPRHRSVAPGVTLNMMSAASPKLDAACIKAYPIVRSDVTVGSSFILLVYRISTGELTGMIEAETLSQIRTGAASAVAAKYLADPDSRTMTLFGSGWQAEGQAIAITHALPHLEHISVVGRNQERVKQFCERLSPRLGIAVEVARNVREAVEEADIITTATGSTFPVFDGAWLRLGTHVNAVGSNFATKREIDSRTIGKASIIVVDDLEVARMESGDLIAADREVGLRWESVVPLSSVVAAKSHGRRSTDEITLFESQGIALEDLAVGCRLLEMAEEQNVGDIVPFR